MRSIAAACGVARAGIALAALASAVPLAGCASLEATRAFERGTTALERGETALAVDELERAAVLAPEVSAVQNHLGIAYEAAGRPSDALRAYQRAVDLDCANEAAGRNLAGLRARRAATEGP
jgi:Flp pilus assembly protein TadD